MGLTMTLWPLENEPWKATIEQTGRFWWYITLHRGLTGLNSGWYVLGGEGHAEKVARRKIRKWNLEADRFKARREIA
jgi:hypothetical protein